MLRLLSDYNSVKAREFHYSDAIMLPYVCVCVCVCVNADTLRISDTQILICKILSSLIFPSH